MTFKYMKLKDWLAIIWMVMLILFMVGYVIYDEIEMRQHNHIVEGEYICQKHLDFIIKVNNVPRMYVIDRMHKHQDDKNCKAFFSVEEVTLND